VLSRLTVTVNWRAGNAALLGLILATELSMYSEMTPILGLCALVTWFVLACGQRRTGLWHLTGLLLITGATTLVVANWEVIRGCRAVAHMMTITVGGDVAWNPWQFLAFALGGRPLDPPTFAAVPWSPGWALSGALLVALLAGALQMARSARALPVWTAVAVLVGLAVYYRFFVRSPFGHDGGHTWNLFKLAQWSFPVVASLEALGVHQLLSRLSGGTRILCCTIVVLGSLPVFSRYAERCAVMGEMAGERDVFAGANRLRQRLDDLKPTAIYYVKDPQEWSRARLITCLLAPYRFANPALPSLLPPSGSLSELAAPPGTLFVVAGQPPFDEPKERLPYISIIDGDRPLVYDVTGPGARRPTSGVVRVGSSATLHIYSPTSGSATLLLDFSGTATASTHEMVVEAVDGTRTEHTFTCPGRVSVPLTVPAGITKVQLLLGKLASEPDFAWLDLAGARVRLGESVETKTGD
jgi:hypothetical protein